MTRDQRSENIGRKEQIRQETREVTLAYWSIAGAALLYLCAVCALKGYGFGGVAVGAAVAAIGALIMRIFNRLEN